LAGDERPSALPTNLRGCLVVDVVGFLGQFVGAVRPIERTWCCDRCREWEARKGREAAVMQGSRLGHNNRRLAESPQKL